MSLRRAAASGVLWTTAGTLLVLAIRLVVVAVIARHVSRSELGLVSMLLALVAMMQAFGDFGLSALIVQRRTLTPEQLSSLFWLAQLAGVATCLLVLALEPMIVALYAEPRLEGLVAWLALRFLVTPVGIPYLAVLQRELQFRRTFIVQISATGIGAAITIVAAVEGHGVHALIAGELATAVVQSLIVLLIGWRVWRPRVRLRVADIREPLRFGFYQIGERALNLIATNVDYVFVGRVLGAEAVGLYAIAFELVSLPTRLNNVVTRVAFPVLARKQGEPAAFNRGLLELVRLIALVQLPVLVALGILAPLLVPVFLGAAWEAAVPIVQILAMFGAIRVLGNPSGPAFLAKGHPELGFYFNLAVAIVTTAVFALVASRGVAAVAWTWNALGAAQLVVLTFMVDAMTGLVLRDWLRALARPMLVAVLAAVYVSLAFMLAQTVSADSLIRLVVALGGATLALVPTAWLVERELLTTFLAQIRARAAGKEAAT